MGTTHAAKRPFEFENVWLEVDGCFDFVKAVWDDFNAFGSSSFVLAKKLNFKSKLKEWNMFFGHLDTKLVALVEKAMVLDAKEQLLSFSWLRDRGCRSRKSFL